MLFDELNLIEPLLRAVKAEGYTTPTPIQVQAIPPALEGRDVLGCAQTGTGKTAAFALPILQRLLAKPAAGRKQIRALILTPTRELASQIGESFTVYGRHTGLTNTVIFGGVGQGAQEKALKTGVDVLVATPGRLLDLMQQGLVSFKGVETFVLDEADRMLDMGFIHDVRRVITAIPKVRQTLFFSATMPPEIQKLSDSILTNPIMVAVTPISSTVEKVEQKLYFVERNDKRALLIELLKNETDITRAIVFTRTKHGANRVAEYLGRAHIPSAAIHGNKSQNARERALEHFKDGEIRVLVATDIAARGIDIEEISHVINYDLPNIPETYVHRIGRTARAGATGIALSFCEQEEREYLVDIERLIGQHVPVVTAHEFASPYAVPSPTDLERKRPGGGGAPRPTHPRPQSAPRGRGQGEHPRPSRQADHKPGAPGSGGGGGGGGRRAQGRRAAQGRSGPAGGGGPSAPPPTGQKLGSWGGRSKGR